MNGRGLLSQYIRGRNISFEIMIRKENADEFTKALDNFRKAVYDQDAYIDRKVAGKIRRIKVKCKTAPVALEHYNIHHGRFLVTFESLEESEYEVNFQDTSIV